MWEGSGGFEFEGLGGCVCVWNLSALVFACALPLLLHLTLSTNNINHAIQLESSTHPSHPIPSNCTQLCAAFKHNAFDAIDLNDTVLPLDTFCFNIVCLKLNF